MLSDSDQYWLMVGGSVDRCKTVDTSRKTVRDVSGNNAVLSCTVDTLEEREPGWVSWCGLVECLQLLDDDVGVADDVALAVNSVKGRGRGLEINLHICVEKKKKKGKRTVAAQSNSSTAHSQSYPSASS